MKRRRILHAEVCVKCGGAINRSIMTAIYCFPCARGLVKVKARAYARTNRRIIKGEIPPPSTLKCADCGDPAQLYDHRSYEPIVIEPCCRSCNVRRGPAFLPLSELVG